MKGLQENFIYSNLSRKSRGNKEDSNATLNHNFIMKIWNNGEAMKKAK